jgi:oxygen-independent coproporphyrinogen-3 oxidase
VLLRLRLADGLPTDGMPPRAISEQVSAGLLDPTAAARGRAVLTLPGRLLADAVVRALLG